MAFGLFGFVVVFALCLVSVLPTCIYEYCMHAWCPQRPEKGSRIPGTGAVRGHVRPEAAVKAVSIESTSFAAVLKSEAEEFTVLAAGAVITNDRIGMNPEHSYIKVFLKCGSEMQIILEIMWEGILEVNVCNYLPE